MPRRHPQPNRWTETDAREAARSLADLLTETTDRSWWPRAHENLGWHYSAVAGCGPEEMGIGPIYAVPKLLARHGLSMNDIDIVELNEAFASQLLQCQRVLEIPNEKLNPCGGSISIGHPFGMTGSRMTGLLLRQLKREGKRYGIVTMCVGGGQGFASLFEAA